MLEIDKIYCGDNCDLLARLPNECVDLVVTSPPYDKLRNYSGAAWDFYGVAWQLKRVIKPGGVIVWVIADATVDGDETGSSLVQALHFKKIGLKLWDTMYFAKLNPFPRVAAEMRHASAVEYMFVFCKGKPKTFHGLMQPCVTAGKKMRSIRGMRCADGKTREKTRCVKPFVAAEKLRSNLWPYGVGQGKTGHPGVFPLALAIDHVTTWSNPGDLVLDPFVGSGTTALAAKQLGRRYIGIDVSPEYVAMAEERLNLPDCQSDKT